MGKVVFQLTCPFLHIFKIQPCMFQLKWTAAKIPLGIFRLCPRDFLYLVRLVSESEGCWELFNSYFLWLFHFTFTFKVTLNEVHCVRAHWLRSLSFKVRLSILEITRDTSAFLFFQYVLAPLFYLNLSQSKWIFFDPCVKDTRDNQTHSL